MNKSIFSTPKTSAVPVANAINAAGSDAYKLSDKETLCNIVMTATFNKGSHGFTGDAQLDVIKKAAAKVSTEFLAQLAIYAHEQGKMKDSPAVLFGLVYDRDPAVAQLIFNRVVTNGKMLRNVATVLRSGATGKVHNLSASGIKRMFQNWFDVQSDERLLSASMGNEPTLADIIKMARVRPNSPSRDAFFGREIGKLKPEKEKNLPVIVQQYDAWRKDRTNPMPVVPFEMLTGQEGLTTAEWREIARRAGWHATRMNLNNFARHGAFNDTETTKLVAGKLADPTEIARVKVFPYQLFIAYKTTEAQVPAPVRNALQDAMEHATANTPNFENYNLFVGIDTSGSMSSAATGDRGSATSAVSCRDVAALGAASMLRANPEATLLPFDTRLHSAADINPRDSVMTITQKLARNGGGTACQLPVEYVASLPKSEKAPLIVIFSDYESWYGSGCRNAEGTPMAKAWAQVLKKDKRAKMVCVDLAPHGTAQVVTKDNALNVAGFSDNVFTLIDRFVNDKLSFVSDVEAVKLI